MRTKLILFSLVVLIGIGFTIRSASAKEFPTSLNPIIKIRTSAEIKAKVNSTATLTGSGSYDQLQSVLDQHMGQPYTWGATGPTTFDCSGLTQYVFNQALNIKLQRTAEQQFHQFKRINRTGVKPGDLIFFTYNHGQSIDHVGIVVTGSNMMIDAQNKGVIRENYMAPWWRDSIAGFTRVFE